MGSKLLSETILVLTLLWASCPGFFGGLLCQHGNKQGKAWPRVTWQKNTIFETFLCERCFRTASRTTGSCPQELLLQFQSLSTTLGASLPGWNEERFIGEPVETADLDSHAVVNFPTKQNPPANFPCLSPPSWCQATPFFLPMADYTYVSHRAGLPPLILAFFGKVKFHMFSISAV